MAHPTDPNLFWCQGCLKWLARDRFKFNHRGEPWTRCLECNPKHALKRRQAVAMPGGKAPMTDDSMKTLIESKGKGFEALRGAYAESLPALGQSLWTFAMGGDMTAAKLVLEIAGKTKDGGGDDEEWKKLQRGQEAS